MQVLNTPLEDVKLLQPQRFGDSRGWFAEVFNQSTFSSAGLPTRFVQDNQSFSVKGVLRIEPTSSFYSSLLLEFERIGLNSPFIRPTLDLTTIHFQVKSSRR